MNFEDAERRLKHGFPLSISEQRELFQLAMEKTIQWQKRCSTCLGAGRVESEYMEGFTHPCQECDGRGYHFPITELVEKKYFDPPRDERSKKPDCETKPKMTPDRMLHCLKIIRGYGHFKPGQDGWAALQELTEHAKNLQKLYAEVWNPS